jgi:hypothetical protein
MDTRYVIRSASGALYSQVDILGYDKRIKQDIFGTDYVERFPKIAPRFDAFQARDASKYSTIEDAESIMAHPDLADPHAFDGCTIEAVEA